MFGVSGWWICLRWRNKTKATFLFFAFESEDHSPLLQCAISQQDNNYFLNKITASYTKVFPAKKKIDLQTRLTFPVKLDTSRQWYWAARSCKTKKQLHRSAVWQMATQPQNFSFPLSLPTTRCGGTPWPLVRFCLLFLPPAYCKTLVFYCLTFKKADHNALYSPAYLSIIFQPPGLFSLAWAGGDSDDPEVRNKIED